MIFKNLWGRKIRTLLTIFGIAVGVAAVVTLGALAEGFIEGYSDMAGGSGADLLVAQSDAVDVMFSAVDEAMGEALRSLSGVEEATGMVYTFAATDNAPYFIVYGYDPEGFAIDHFKIVAGESLSRRASTRGGKPLLLGRTAAEDLDKSVGDTFRLYESTYRIVGLYETGQPFEDGAAVLLLEDAQQISKKPHKVNAFLLKLRSDADVDRLRQRIQQRFSNVTISTSSDFGEEQEMLQYLYAFTWTVSLVALLIGGVGVMNTMLMSVVERTREFGVLRAVGWRPWRILMMVLGESLALSLLGGGCGILLGMLALRGMQDVPTVGNIVRTLITPALFAQGMGVAIGLGTVGGALPAWRASRLMPAEAMRTEGGGAVHTTRHVRSATLRNIIRQPFRTILTLIGIAIAMLAIVLLGAMGEGLIDAVGGLAMGGGAHLVGSEADASVDLSAIDEGIVRRIETLDGVRAAEGFLTGYTVLGDLPFFVVFGYEPRGLSIRKYEIVAGEPLATSRQIILGRVAADNLEKEVGDTLRLFDQAFKVVGIYETGVSFQDGGGVVTLREAQKLFGQPRKVSFLGVWLEDPSRAETMAERIEARFPEVSLSKASEFAEGLTDMQMMEAGTWGISLITLIVGGLGMTNTMVMSVLERTREIGVLRALGWRKRRVLGMIIRESVALSLVGSVLGVVGGVLLGWGLNLHPMIQGFFQLTYEPIMFAQAFGTALMLGVIGGAYPAWRAANLQPVEALRYE
jgi:ABC-type antimicrobial peptide transport system permease subunit